MVPQLKPELGRTGVVCNGAMDLGLTAVVLNGIAPRQPCRNQCPAKFMTRHGS